MTTKKKSSAIEFITNGARRYVFLMATNILACILIFPFAMLAGWLTFRTDMRIDRIRHFGDAQEILAYTISGVIILSVDYFLIQWPVTIWLKIKIKEKATSDEPNKGRYLKWRWYLGGANYPDTCASSKAPAFIYYVVHAMTSFLLNCGGIAVVAFIIAYIIISGSWPDIKHISNALFFILMVVIEIMKMLT